MHHNPNNLDELPLEMLREIASELDFASLLNLKSTSKFFAANILLTPQTYQKTVNFLNLTLNLLNRSREISMETKFRVSAGAALLTKCAAKNIYFMDQEKIDKELVLLQSEFGKFKSIFPSTTGYIFSNSGKCYLLNEGKLSKEPTEYTLSEEEIKTIKRVTDNTNKKLDLALLTQKQASEITKIIKAAYNEDISLMPSQKEMANNIKKLVALCVATYTSAMLAEDDRYGLRNVSNPGKLWCAYTSWKTEIAEFSKLNKKFENGLFIEFLADRLVQEKLPFSTDLIHPQLVGVNFNSEQLQQFLLPLESNYWIFIIL